MVHSGTRLSFITFTLLVFLSSSFGASLHANKVVDPSFICSRALTDQAFCLRLLNSTPPGPGADLVTLAEFTTNVAHTNVTNIISLLKKLIASGHGHNQHYKKCLLEYSGRNGALHYVEEIQKGLKSKEYTGMEDSLMSLLARNSNCILGEAGTSIDKQPPSDPKLLDEYGVILAEVGVVLHDIFIYLMGI